MTIEKDPFVCKSVVASSNPSQEAEAVVLHFVLVEVCLSNNLTVQSRAC